MKEAHGTYWNVDIFTEISGNKFLEASFKTYKLREYETKGADARPDSQTENDKADYGQMQKSDVNREQRRVIKPSSYPRTSGRGGLGRPGVSTTPARVHATAHNELKQTTILMFTSDQNQLSKSQTSHCKRVKISHKLGGSETCLPCNIGTFLPSPTPPSLRARCGHSTATILTVP